MSTTGGEHGDHRSPAPPGGRDGTVPARRIEALCAGEALVAVAADGLAVDGHAELHVAGAELNVAVGLAAQGHGVEWFGRVGDDPFGRRILAALDARGVERGRAVTDPRHPTGLYLKDRARGEVRYHRAGSAASRLDVGDAETLTATAPRLLHLTGITPALSPGCRAFITRLLEPPGRAALVSFDVNHRPALWSDGDAATALLDCARAADIVFVGRDEAERLWGAATPAEVRALLPQVRTLVVKDADVAATAYTAGCEVSEPAPAVDVADAVGAGDAFAAGYLGALLDGEPPAHCLRRGHVLAGYALSVRGDHPEYPSAARLRAEARMRDDEDQGPAVTAPHDNGDNGG